MYMHTSILIISICEDTLNTLYSITEKLHIT